MPDCLLNLDQWDWLIEEKSIILEEFWKKKELQKVLKTRVGVWSLNVNLRQLEAFFLAKNHGPRICPGILLWILSILTYSGPQTDNRSKTYDHLKFTGHLCYFCFSLCNLSQVRVLFCYLRCCLLLVVFLFSFLFLLDSVSNFFLFEFYFKFCMGTIWLTEEFRGLGFSGLLNLFAY